MRKICWSIDLLFITLFFIILCVPNFHFSKEELSEKENRMFAKYVPLIVNGKINLNYTSNFEDFLNDRFFTRNVLISLNDFVKQFFYSSQEQTNKMNGKVIQGKEGWLFYRGDKSELNFLNYDLFTEDEMIHGLKYLNDIKTWCDANNKIFVFLIVPDKNKIYGEYFPNTYEKIRPDNDSHTYQFINFVQQNSNIPIIYPYEDLITEKKENRILYYKNDTHWNYDGAFIGYKSLMKEIQKSLDVEQIVADSFEPYKNPKGDLNDLFPELRFIPDETTIYYMPKIDSSFKDITESNSENNFLHTINDDKKYKAIFFRDSFSEALKEFISNTFEEVVYYWRYNITTKDLELISNNADVVVLECVERYLPDVLSQTFPKTEVTN